MSLIEKYGISSLAAPTEADTKIMRGLTDDQRRAIIAEQIALGEKDIAEGRYTELDSDEAIDAFFEETWSRDEASAI